jgi:hypothetical protein
MDQPHGQNDWFTKDRSETASNRMADRAIGHIKVSNPALGINVYSGAISSDQGKKYIDTLEANLNGQTRYEWQGARVTSSAEVALYARNALDFKISSTNLGPKSSENAELYEMHERIFQAIRQCVDDYGRSWGVGIASYESFNFVKYDGPGTHFKVHADHGPTYVCTISVVVYLNDDYEGGEIHFPRFDKLTIKPKAGDIVVFPSTFIYEHASQDMVSGIKYAVVVMTDYNDRDGVNHRVSPTIEAYELKY